MKKKLRHIHIKCPVFKFNIEYIVDCDYKQLEKYIKKKYNFEDTLDWLESADGTYFKIGDKNDNVVAHIVWLESFKMNHKEIGVLAHETVHAVVRILDWKGMPYSSTDNQDETFAYLTDYLISNFIHKYKNG
jgi:hypothetical protein